MNLTNPVKIKIGDRYVGSGEPVYIIAEIGINHNGSLEVAKKLIAGAKAAGCDAVKFQKRTIDQVYTAEFLDSYRESPWGTTQRAQKEGLELSAEIYQEIKDVLKNSHKE